jgi:hypothetical protein
MPPDPIHNNEHTNTHTHTDISSSKFAVYAKYMGSLCIALFTGIGIFFPNYLCTVPYAASHSEVQIQSQVQQCNVRDNKK